MHDCKLRVDGISKYLDSVGFRFDHAFGEEENNQLVGWWGGDGLMLARRLRNDEKRQRGCGWFSPVRSCFLFFCAVVVVAAAASAAAERHVGDCMLRR